ncbi:MAG TPA: Gfo/Idh/MocA family oxidoreductase [Verrucomicrobiae bacterium]|jgi:predicted dehydrogenase|nr:Gfo/Idh/MocA family oxidoreductase [Verrucomicrobiae bacterium]
MNETNQSSFESQLNRRSFLKTTSAAVVGSALLGSASAQSASDDTIKIALIGCGGRGSGAAAQALSTKGNVKLVAMADAFDDRLKSSLENLKKAHPDRVDVPEDRQFIGFDAYQKAIPLADLVILSTPPGFRPIHFEAAVAAGKNIFMEKPVAVDGPGIRKVLAAAEIAKQKNLKIGVGFQRHHQIQYIEAMKRLHDGAIGDIHTVRVYWNGNRPWLRPRKPGMNEMQFQMTNWYYFSWLCGDHIVEQHIHNLDVGNWIKQAHPIRAVGMGGCQTKRVADNGEIFDHHAVEYQFADGSRMFSQCRHMQGCWDAVSEHAVGTKGTADLQDGRDFIIKGDNAWQFKDGKTSHISPYQVEHDDLFAAIRNNTPYNELIIYGANSTLTAIMGRMATYSGREITWEEALNSEVNLAPSEYSWDAIPKAAVGPDGLYPMPIPGDPEWLKKVV